MRRRALLGVVNELLVLPLLQREVLLVAMRDGCAAALGALVTADLLDAGDDPGMQVTLAPELVLAISVMVSRHRWHRTQPQMDQA
jgi:hypothetical protein